MTRDDAIKLVGDTGAIHPSAFIDMCVSLGMLKLDEPESLERRIEKTLAGSFGIFATHDETARFKRLADLYGLKIVEK